MEKVYPAEIINIQINININISININIMSTITSADLKNMDIVRLASHHRFWVWLRQFLGL